LSGTEKIERETEVALILSHAAGGGPVDVAGIKLDEPGPGLHRGNGKVEPETEGFVVRIFDASNLALITENGKLVGFSEGARW
jgi:hypothetical protein